MKIAFFGISIRKCYPIYVNPYGVQASIADSYPRDPGSNPGAAEIQDIIFHGFLHQYEIKIIPYSWYNFLSYFEKLMNS